MNYEANTIKWKPGDFVLHDADAKKPEMLMRVLRVYDDGRVITMYATPNQMNGDDRRRPRPSWQNSLTHLHDPARFGIAANAGLDRQEEAKHDA